MRSEKTHQSHATMEVAKALAEAAKSMDAVRAALQTARERTLRVSGDETAQLRARVALLSELAATLHVGLSGLAHELEIRAWSLGRDGQAEEREARLAAERAKLAGEG